MNPKSLASFPLLAIALLGQGKDWPYSMDYGPYLMTTFDGRDQSEFTYKGVVVKLGAAGAVAFDTELLRLSAAWTDGFLHLRGTAYDGAHGPMPRLRGRKIAEVKFGPGWAKAGDFADPRAIPYGPLPKEWGAYKGLWLHGDKVVVGYRVDDMEVLEHYAAEGPQNGQFLSRTLELGPSAREQWLVVLDAPEGAQPGSLEAGGEFVGAGPTAAIAALQWQVAAPELVELDISTTGWDRLAMGGPSTQDYLDGKSGTGATIAFVPGFARAHDAPKATAGVTDPPGALLLPKLQDGKAALSDDDWKNSQWFDKLPGDGDDRDDGRWLVDLRKVVEVSRVSTFAWHQGHRSVQQYDLFGSDAEVAPAADAKDPAAAGWRKIAGVNSNSLGQGDKHGVSIAKADGLGRFRHLLFVVRSGNAFFSEVDVWADRFRAPIDATGREPVHAACVAKAEPGTVELVVRGSRMLLRVPAHDRTVRAKLVLSGGNQAQFAALGHHAGRSAPPIELAPLTQAAPGRWGAPIAGKGQRGAADEAWAVDTVEVPFENRYGSRMRTAALDFFADGRAAISTWNGDVWIVSGLDDDLKNVSWQRFATGLHDPLGLRIVDGTIYVHGRDGITRLHDGNGDGEADFYECFNHDVYITNAFHEFAFDLQTDAAGNFYVSKGGPVNPGGRGFMKVVPHHGTILKIGKDGQRLDVIATGLRAPNGIGVGPDGVITSGDNEGTFMPRCRLNWITKPGFYAGVKDLAHRQPVPDQPDLPLCWMPMEVDNSSGGQTWVTSDRWGPFAGRLLHLSYGTCSLYLVLKEEVDGIVQGGVVRFPCNFASSAMRARFHPRDGQLWLTGFQGWQTSAAREGCLHRIRWTGQTVKMPTALKTTDKGVYLTFLEPLERESGEDPANYGVEIWNYLYSPNYGSPELSILHPERRVEQGKPNRDPLPITSAKLSPDKRTVFLAIPGMQPVNQMKITWDVDLAGGKRARGELHNSIHKLAADQGFPAAQEK
ncbi:MAG: hypothetical protein IPK26_09640 [Planctomycetes bacterium]|nr:hypothetical protein [Planctomycetota bacterium]